MSQPPAVVTGSDDAIARLDADLLSLQRLFEALQAVQGREALAEKAALAEQIGLELSVHGRALNELLFPALEVSAPPRDLLQIDQARGELVLVDDLVDQLAELPPDDELFDATLQLLSQLLQRQAQRERDGLFGLARRSRLDLQALGVLIARNSERWMADHARRLGRRGREDESADPVGAPT